MANFVSGLLHGMVFETDVESWTGQYLYSDFATGKAEKDTTLNTLVKIPFIGIAAAIGKVVLLVFHTLGHLCLALVTLKKGHLFHAAKGACEILRGGIEIIPIVGRIFTNAYNSTPRFDPLGMGGRSWWMIKVYNPQKPDGLDEWMDYWVTFPKRFHVR